jgi:putative PIG3 family NAD(P)H quinone oxidoreductase
MRAAVVEQYGGPEAITVREVPDPIPGPDEIRVAVSYSACNRADTLQRQGAYPDPIRREHEILGLEYAGRVESVGERVTRWAIGDRVMGIEAGACNASMVVTHERMALRVPDRVDDDEMGAIPEVFITAWDALCAQGGLTAGRWALVHAGGSGVGTAAIQIARAIGAKIAVTCSARKADACRALGADLVLERSPADWLDALKTQLPDGVDVVLDVIGGEEADRNLKAVKTQGTIMQVGLMGGGLTTVNAGLILTKRVHWIGTTLRNRPIEQKIQAVQAFAAEMLPLFDSGALRPVVDTTFALDDIAEAHRHMEADANIGKILLKM